VRAYLPLVGWSWGYHTARRDFPSGALKTEIG
jgi:hypothetical protein